MFHERQGTSIQSQALMSSSAPGLFHRAWISRALRSFLRMRQRWNALLQTTWSQEHSADFGKLPGQGSAEEGNCGSALSTGSAQGAVCSQEKSGNCWISDPITCSLVKSILREFQRCFPAPSCSESSKCLSEHKEQNCPWCFRNFTAAKIQPTAAGSFVPGYVWLVLLFRIFTDCSLKNF